MLFSSSPWRLQMKTLFYTEQSEAKQLTALERDETIKLA